MNNLRYLRQEVALSLTQLADMAGVSFGLISKLEKGTQCAGDSAALSIGKALGVTPEFVKGEEERGIIVFKEAKSGALDPMPITPLEYAEYKGRGLLIEEVWSDGKIPSLSERFPTLHLEQYKGKWEGRFVMRILRYVDPYAIEAKGEGHEAEEIAALVRQMDKDQLRKTLLMIKEVILK